MKRDVSRRTTKEIYQKDSIPGSGARVRHMRGNKCVKASNVSKQQMCQKRPIHMKRGQQTWKEAYEYEKRRVKENRNVSEQQMCQKRPSYMKRG